MISWPWIVAAFGLGVLIGAGVMLYVLMDLKLRCDDARAEGSSWHL